jgi:hypothetical protein
MVLSAKDESAAKPLGQTLATVIENGGEQTLATRVRDIKPYEVLIMFVLVVLLALCIVVAQVVVQDVHPPSARVSATPRATVGLNSAFAWGV